MTTGMDGMSKRQRRSVCSRRRAGMGLALTALALAGCGTPVPGGETAVPRPGGQTAGRKRAPDFQITVYQGEAVLGGKEVRFADVLRRGKPVVLNFWAGLCPPCRLEMPDLQAIATEYQDHIVLFGLDVGPFVGLGSREAGKALLRELNITYPAGTTFDAEVVRAYRLLGMPTTVFITPAGNIVNTWAGLLTKPKMVELIQELLTASGR